MRNEFLEECLILLKREDIKQNIKEFINPILNPIISILIKEINPYIYLSLIFVIISFLLHLGIFILLIRNKSFS
uniref:Uncharacterized protein n=1 Tax=viral metagenome TaxID=1070528 RepID=A0A6C0AY26_9ZZZZ